jgi:hypothetical protein
LKKFKKVNNLMTDELDGILQFVWTLRLLLYKAVYFLITIIIIIMHTSPSESSLRSSNT